MKSPALTRRGLFRATGTTNCGRFYKDTGVTDEPKPNPSRVATSLRKLSIKVGNEPEGLRSTAKRLRGTRRRPCPRSWLSGFYTQIRRHAERLRRAPEKQRPSQLAELKIIAAASHPADWSLLHFRTSL